MPRHYTLPFRSSDVVRQIDDPRHVGCVRAVFNSLNVRVEWDDTLAFGRKMLSDLPAAKLEITTRD